ncbi:MAG: hypothetical protein IPL71_09575 [Anaerolineales bacterium]|uniref:hypothetical protein n=1 Tax=Candidatus Villigracilis proximus TaxID=3140683 RepID=UPI0031367D5A|nr:hypothetical protein [Anaerolineales bacterium]
MRLKWGGTWVLKGSERILSIKNAEFSPIGFVYQKITSHPEYSVKQYFAEAERKISPSPVIPPQPQKISEGVSQPTERISANQPQNTVTIDKKLIVYAIAAMAALCVVGILAITVYSNIQATNEFKTKLNAFLVEAEKLNTMTEQGVSYQEFRTQLVEVKSTYASIDSWPMSYQNGRRSFDLAIKGWDYTLDSWTYKLDLVSGKLIWYTPDYESARIYLGKDSGCLWE